MEIFVKWMIWKVFLGFKVCRFGISGKLYDITFRILKALPFTLF